MKTELQIKKEIDEVTAAAMDYFKMKDYAASRRMVKKKQELNLFLHYLETKPSEEFLKKDIAHIKKPPAKLIKPAVLNQNCFCSTKIIK